MKNSLVCLFFLILAFAQSAFGQTVSIPALQTVNYKYHIRGGLLGINLDNSNNATPNYNEGDLFSYKLDYETADKWNGTIGKQTWARASDLALPCNIDTRSYTFTYDPAQRLTSAAYTGVGNYSLPLINYDKNSNITGLQRNGWLGGSHGLIDNLSYGYTGNQLTTVTDGVGGNHTVDLAPKLTGARTYYEDGSLKSDENKAINLIVYDPFLMLPTRIELTSGRWINMGYAMDGELEIREYSTGETWVYTSGMSFLNGQPYSMPIPEGRAMYTAGSWKSEFFITDHLGNVRVTFEEQSGQLKPKDYADFDATGVELNNSNISVTGFKLDLFKFQDKEQLSSSFGLNGLHDFGPRMLDKTLGGIWSQPDILSEINVGQSTYGYVNGNPLSYIDPTGLASSSTDENRGADGLTDEEWLESSKPVDEGRFSNNNQTSLLGNPNNGGGSGRMPGAEAGKNLYQKGNEYLDKSGITETLISINEWNPLANLINGFAGIFTGSDINGRKMSGFSPALSIVGAFPFARPAGALIKGASTTAQIGIQYTKSSMKLGREIHASYKLADHAPTLGRFKEFTGIKGIRPDFVDFGTKTIYELKPFNPRSIQSGKRQLNNYKLLFEKNYGGKWETVLDKY